MAAEEVIKICTSKMKKAFEVFSHDLASLRTGRANVSMLDIIKFEGLTVNKLSQEVELDQKLIHLSTTEFEALLLFVENPGEVLDREFLVENIRFLLPAVDSGFLCMNVNSQ